MKKASNVSVPAVTEDAEMPGEVRIVGGVRGRYFPTDEPERSRKLMERLKTMQDTAGQLYDENTRLRILLAWEAGALTEEQAAKRLTVDPVTLRGYREAALRDLPPGPV